MNKITFFAEKQEYNLYRFNTLQEEKLPKLLRTFLIVIIASLMSMILSKTDIHIIYRLLISISAIYFVLWFAELVIKKLNTFKRFTS